MTFVLTFDARLSINRSASSRWIFPLTYWAITNLNSGMQRRSKREETQRERSGWIDKFWLSRRLIVCCLLFPPEYFWNLSVSLSLCQATTEGSNGSYKKKGKHTRTGTRLTFKRAHEISRPRNYRQKSQLRIVCVSFKQSLRQDSFEMRPHYLSTTEKLRRREQIPIPYSHLPSNIFPPPPPPCTALIPISSSCVHNNYFFFDPDVSRRE